MDIRYCLLQDNSISKSKFKEFERLVPIFLKDIEKKYNIKYKKGCHKCSDLYVILATTELTNAIFNSGENIDFSWTDQSCNVITFGFNNWDNLKLDGDKEKYRKYVIHHEFLHAFPFYLGHNKDVCSKNDNYNVMYQQTRNAEGLGRIQKTVCETGEIELPDITVDLKNEFKKLNSQQTAIKKKRYNLLKRFQTAKVKRKTS